MRAFLYLALLLISAPFFSGPARAEPLLGVWATVPDQKGQIAHVVANACDTGICGTIVRTYDKSGKEIVTQNVGKNLFWGMTPQGADLGGDVYRGKGWIPNRDLTFNAKLTIKGDQLLVRGCVAVICKKQIWTRVSD